MNNMIKTKLNDIAKLNGYDYASRQCIEEMCELIQAINKFWRYQHKFGSNSVIKECDVLDNLTEEIADVLITIENLKYLLSIDDSEIEAIMESKIEKFYSDTDSYVNSTPHEK